MLQAFYTGLSGLNTYSKNLDNVSNNIANMNSPGYRGIDSFYRALGGEEGKGGFGAQISGLGYRFSTGDIRQTGNEFDMAITGRGFFALMDGSDVYYTRTGQFDFDENQILIDKNTGFKVAGVDSNGQLKEISLADYQAISPTASTKVTFSGNLSPEDDAHQIGNVKFINSLGEEVELNFHFTNEKALFPNQWKVEILNSAGEVLHTDSLIFGADGTPEVGSGSFNFSLPDSSGNSNSVLVELGRKGDFSAITHTNSTGTNSNVAVTNTDGRGIGSLLSRSFNENGEISLRYSNGDELTPMKLAMVDFHNLQDLELKGGTIFKSRDSAERIIGAAGDGRFSALATKSIEMSNVDLSQEFADMLVIQRGYQASSRILNVSNQMLEQLYESTRGR
jgi:flagellar hook protein FlgE